MGFELGYKIHGRKVSRYEWERHIAREAKGIATNELRDRLPRAALPHSRPGSPVLNIRRTGDRFEFKTEACCETMLEKAQRTAVRM